MPYDPKTGQWIPESPAVSQFGGQLPGGGQFSPEMNAYMMENMPAITQQESELQRAVALSEQLRQGQNPLARKRMDAASQGARAIEGIGSGIQDYKAAKGIADIQGKKKTYYEGAAEIARREAAAARQAGQGGKNVAIDYQNPLTRNPFDEP